MAGHTVVVVLAHIAAAAAVGHTAVVVLAHIAAAAAAGSETQQRWGYHCTARTLAVPVPVASPAARSFAPAQPTVAASPAASPSLAKVAVAADPTAAAVAGPAARECTHTGPFGPLGYQHSAEQPFLLLLLPHSSPPRPAPHPEHSGTAVD